METSKIVTAIEEMAAENKRMESDLKVAREAIAVLTKENALLGKKLVTAKKMIDELLALAEEEKVRT